MTETRPERADAIERATGVTWDEWMRHFTSTGAAEKPHSEIAKIARALMPDDLKNPDWWAQGVAIAFEHQVGLRVPGESSTGTFQLSVSRTMPGGRDDLLAAWIHQVAGNLHQGLHLTDERTSRTEKRSYWRATLEGVGKLDVSAAVKDATKAVLTVQHLELPSASAIDGWRAYWKSQIAEL